jgi:predicted enzyme related to lactoylglutathione lyase
MSEANRGRVGWVDLTVDRAEAVRDFYSAVMGWEAEGLEMGGYDDYVMTPEGSDEPTAGVCHRKGQNADLPPQWIVYFTVDDVEAAVQTALRNGGSMVRQQTDLNFALMKDPAGAIFALHSGESDSDG